MSPKYEFKKNRSKRWNFRYWGVKSYKKFLVRESCSFFLSFWFSQQVSEQSDQEGRKLDSRLSCNANQNKIVLPTGLLIKLVRTSDRYSCESSN